MKSGKYKAVIVDDERLARNVLASLLKDFPEIEIVGEAKNVRSAVEVIGNTKPDIVFLDIQMPGESGFDLLERIKPDFFTIFVTAYDEFAVRAFEVNALDYLLKPINKERLKNSIGRLSSAKEKSAVTPPATYHDKLFLHVEGFVKIVQICSIIQIAADKDYSIVHTNDNRSLRTLRTLKEWELKLPPKNFLRINKSTIVNLEMIRSVESTGDLGFQLSFASIPHPTKVSRRYAAQLKRHFKS